MKIAIDSDNAKHVKRIILKEYGKFSSPQAPHPQFSINCLHIDLPPISLEETMSQACNGAKKIFSDCDLSISIKSGLKVVPDIIKTHMDVYVCAIFDGEDYYVGFSPAYIYPSIVMRLSNDDNGKSLEKTCNASQRKSEANIQQAIYAALFVLRNKCSS